MVSSTYNESKTLATTKSLLGTKMLINAYVSSDQPPLLNTSLYLTLHISQPDFPDTRLIQITRLQNSDFINLSNSVTEYHAGGMNIQTIEIYLHRKAGHSGLCPRRYKD
jgi:hypothetical protein